MLKDLADIHFSLAKTIVLIQDNLNVHSKAALYEVPASAVLTAISDNSAWTAPRGLNFRGALREMPVPISDLHVDMAGTLQAPAESIAARKVA